MARGPGIFLVATIWAATPLAPVACSPGESLVEVSAGDLGIRITPEGRIGSFTDLATHQEYLPEGMAPPLLTLRIGEEDLLPVRARFRPADSTIRLLYSEGLEAIVRLRTRTTHLALELVEISDARSGERGEGSGSSAEESDLPRRSGAPGGPGSSRFSPVDLAIWGPYPTTIRETIGETVGVVRGGGFAMGLQALNPKTLGGFPWNENDAMPQLDIFESGDYTDLDEEGKRSVLYRVEAAKPDSFGSTLQAYVRARSEARVIPNWGVDRYVAPPFQDGGIPGSAIALFGCPEEDALSVLGAIEVAEGLPHPAIDGVWGKEARTASAAYVILPFSESTLDRALDVTLKAGLRYLYHPEPFATWGHFPLNDDFPSGVDGLRKAVERAAERGVFLGVHTLSNFITPNDAYVTPTPDPRLARVGSTVLTSGVSTRETEIDIQSPEFFDQLENDNLRSAVLGDEIVQYRAVSDTPPWRLLDVRRGAFGTGPAAHEAGDSVGKLADHAYRVFLTDPDLTVEVARNLAALFNETGLRQISFDGLEGNRSTGMGNYGEILFTSTWYDALSPEIRGHFIADASRTSHYFWHIFSRMNWGEPWYAGFRESQTEYRLKNQAYFRRNLMPGMLGWFRMSPETSVEDIEWMLARSAAFDAGYGFVTSFEALEENGRAEEILQLLGRWEAARMANVFSLDQKRRMEDIANEFHLEEAGGGEWILQQVHTTTHRFENRVRQPGEPWNRAFSFENPVRQQALGFILTVAGGTASGIRMGIDGGEATEIPLTLRDGEALVYEGGESASLYSSHWQLLRRIPMDPEAVLVAPGAHELGFDARLSGGEDAVIRVEVRMRAPGERVAGDRDP